MAPPGQGPRHSQLTTGHCADTLGNMERYRVRELLNMNPGEAPVLCKGWIRTARDSKNIVFFEVNDGSSMKNLQIILDKDKFQGLELGGLQKRRQRGGFRSNGGKPGKKSEG
jgi:lysyl-tRNA synthetase class II